MSTIWKYALQPGHTELEMPAGAELLTVQMQGDTPTLWAQVWPGEPMAQRVLDERTIAKVELIGGGNLSAGLREAVRRVRKPQGA